MTSGGKREGAGRPKAEPTETITFRINADILKKVKRQYGKELNKKVNAYFKRLAK